MPIPGSTSRVSMPIQPFSLGQLGRLRVDLVLVARKSWCESPYNDERTAPAAEQVSLSAAKDPRSRRRLGGSVSGRQFPQQ
jgi:hypothetical protein